MVSLDSPLLTLGGMFILGNSSRGREFTGGESGKGIVAGGFAGASAEYVAQEAKSLAGLGSDTVSDELAQALVGAGLSRFGDPVPMNNAMARGIHYNVATQSVQDSGLALGDLIGDVTNGGGGDTSGAQHRNTSRQSHQRRRRTTTNIDWA